MAGPNGINPKLLAAGARLLSQRAVVRLDLAPGITMEIDEPNPNMIDPSIAATMQGFVASLHAICTHNRQISTLDSILQHLAHLVSYQARRIELLEERMVMPMPDDEHGAEVAASRSAIEELSNNLRAAIAREREKLDGDDDPVGTQPSDAEGQG